MEKRDEIKSGDGLFLCSLPEGPLHITKLPESAASMLIRTPCKRACGVLINIEAQRCALSFVICGEDESGACISILLVLAVNMPYGYP